MHGGEAWVAREIAGIERQQVSEAMNAHRCGKPRSVNLDADHSVRDHEPPPFVVDRLVIGQQYHAALDHADFAIDFRRR
jgi:hypothetical protein